MGAGHISPEELAKALNQETYDDNIDCLFYFYRHMKINDIRLHEEGKKWHELENEYEYLKKDIPDLILKNYCNIHVMALKGVYSTELFYVYFNNAPSSDLKREMGKAIAHFHIKGGVLDYSSTRVAGRIQYLKCGGEPKWELN